MFQISLLKSKLVKEGKSLLYNSPMKSKILVIDDSEDVQFLIASALKGNYEITAQMTAKSAIESINTETFDLILLDLMLPDISGFELATLIRQSHKSGDTSVIVISNKSDVNSMITAYSLGAINYVHKPFDSALLNSIVKSTLAVKTHEKSNTIDLDFVSVNVLNQSIEIEEESIKTTSSEFKIFCYLLQRAGQVVSREVLFKIVSLDTDKPSDRVIDTHISSLRKKLKSDKVSIKAEYKTGYVLNILQ